MAMIIARAPVRISYGGGGTDMPEYYAPYGGMVISATINKYFYIIVRPSRFDGVQIISSDYGRFLRKNACEDLSWDGDLALPKAILHHFGLRRGLEIFLASEVPPGTGLGSSSALTVAMIRGISTWLGQEMSSHEIAELACHIEIEKMRMPVGKQDQYAATFGGLNVIAFSENEVTIRPLDVDLSVRQQLERNLMLFFTGRSRSSSSILSEQKAATSSSPIVIEALHSLKAIALDMEVCLLNGDLSQFGDLLDAAWHHKKKLVDRISNSLIDQCYDTARKLGALGGKIAGAGGGGFLMLYAEEYHQPTITQALQGLGLQRMSFDLEDEGVSIISYTPEH